MNQQFSKDGGEMVKKYTKNKKQNWSSSLDIREMQIKPTLWFILSLTSQEAYVKESESQ